MLTIVCFRDLLIIEVCVYFYDDYTLKIKIKHKYNYTDSPLMG